MRLAVSRRRTVVKGEFGCAFVSFNTFSKISFCFVFECFYLLFLAEIYRLKLYNIRMQRVVDTFKKIGYRQNV